MRNQRQKKNQHFRNNHKMCIRDRYSVVVFSVVRQNSVQKEICGDEGSARRETNENQKGVVGRRTRKRKPENEAIQVKEKRTSVGEGRCVIMAHKWLKR